MPPTSHHLTLRELSFRLLEWAPPAAPTRVPVLFLHGFADTAASWGPVAELMTQAGHRVMAPDLRGFGESAWVGAGGYYHFPDYVADVDALTRAMSLSSFALVGHSMGGTVASMFAGSRPAKVRHLALLEGLGPPDNDPAHTPDRFSRWLDDLIDGGRGRQRSMSLGEALERLERQHPGVPRKLLADTLPSLLREESPGVFRWHLDPLHRTSSPYPFFASSYRAFAARVDCPVLLLDGGPEGFHPPDEAERIAAFARHEVSSLPGAGHMMHWTQPEAVARELLRFLSAGEP
jgi:pimeloyl-ACP methyl ester carboxylesterase